MGAVPGDIPVPVLFRYQPSVTAPWVPAASSDRAADDASLPDCGLWSNLSFGYLTAPGQGGGAQVLENGTVFRDRDWKELVEDPGLPLAFGLNAPPEGFTTEGSRTYGFYPATLAELGRWRSQVSQLTAMRAFKVILDRQRARIYGYQEALHTFVPVLWLDRFGHWVSFRWQQNTWVGGEAFTVQVTSPEGKGVQVSWAAPSVATGIVDLLRTDFVGITAPSLRVRGYPGMASGPEAARGLPAGRGALARPTQLQLGPSGSLAVPPSVPSLPAAPELAPQVRSWTFNYSDDHPNEPSTFQDPRGRTTAFTFQSYAFPGGGPVLRGVSQASSVDPVTGVTFVQTWSRVVPAQAGDPWTVRTTSGYSDGEATEGRVIVHTFLDQGAGPEQAMLQSVQVQGDSGNSQTTLYARGAPTETGSPSCDKIQVSATGEPPLEILRTRAAGTADLSEEVLNVDGVEVETRSFIRDAASGGLGPNLPRVVTVTRQGLPSVQVLFAHSAQGVLTRQALQAGGQEKGCSYSYDGEGRLVGAGLSASWAAGIGMNWTYRSSSLGPTALTLSGNQLAPALQEAWEYSDSGLVISHTDAEGHCARVSYDLWGRPLSFADNGSPTTFFSYPDARTRTWRRGPCNGWEQCDGFGRLRAKLRGDGVTETYFHDRYGRVVRVEECEGSVVRSTRVLAYDALDRLIAEQSGTGPARSHGYSARGMTQVVTTTRADGAVCTRSLDPWGQEVASTDASATIHTTYNEFGQVTQVLRQEPGGMAQVRNFEFDDIGKLTRGCSGALELGRCGPWRDRDRCHLGPVATRVLLFPGLVPWFRAISAPGSAGPQPVPGPALLPGLPAPGREPVGAHAGAGSVHGAQSARASSGAPPRRTRLNQDAFVDFMNSHAHNSSQQRCAAAVRRGLEAGGLDLTGRPNLAKDYGPYLITLGFALVPAAGWTPIAGDIVVFDGNETHPSGHIAMYNGSRWISDFRQVNMVPYRSHVPPYNLYRYVW